MTQQIIYPTPEKTENLSDKEKCKIVEEEINKFNKLVGEHRELLFAIGKL